MRANEKENQEFEKKKGFELVETFWIISSIGSHANEKKSWKIAKHGVCSKIQHTSRRTAQSKQQLKFERNPPNRFWDIAKRTTDYRQIPIPWFEFSAYTVKQR